MLNFTASFRCGRVVDCRLQRGVSSAPLDRPTSKCKWYIDLNCKEDCRLKLVVNRLSKGELAVSLGKASGGSSRKAPMDFANGHGFTHDLSERIGWCCTQRTHTKDPPGAQSCRPASGFGCETMPKPDLWRSTLESSFTIWLQFILLHTVY